MKVDVFGGSRGFPGSSGQLSTCRIDWRCQIQHPEGLDQSKTTSKYQKHTKISKIQIPVALDLTNRLVLSKASSELTIPLKIHFKVSTFYTIQVDNLMMMMMTMMMMMIRMMMKSSANQEQQDQQQ